MTLIDVLLIILVVGYCALVLFSKKKTGCSGNCSGCCCGCKKKQ